MLRLVPFTAVAACVAASVPSSAQETSGSLEARVWVDRGDEPVVRPGDDVRVYYRTSENAFAAIFRIDTDGRVHLVYPQHPDAIDVVRGGRDYRLLFPDGPAWRVNEDPGAGYFFIVASPEPLDFSSFAYDERYGWDVSTVGEVVYSDPYVAIDDYVARIVPDWEVVPYALDFLTYSVGQTYSYPRFLCYDCHSYRRYSTWNPYDYTCSTFRVVIWDDPYFYPRYRYSGINVVVAARPVRASLPRYEVARRVVGDPVAPVIRVRTPVERRAVQFRDAANAAPPTRSQPVRRSTAAAALTQERPRATPQQVPDTARSRPTLQRRPSSRLPVRTPPAPRTEQPESSQAAPTTRAAPSRLPVRTPAARPSAASAEPRTPAATPRGSREPAAAPEQSRPSAVRARPTAPSDAREPRSEPRIAPRGEPRNEPRSEPRAAPRSERSQPRAAPQGSASPQSRPSVRAAPSPRSGSSGGSSRPQVAPRSQAAPRSNGGGSRPSASSAPSRPSSSPSARSSAPSRSTEQRPTVRPRAEPR